MTDIVESRATVITIDRQARVFDVDDPVLPDWIKDKALESGDFPYKKKLKRKDYDKELEALQKELVKLQFWQQKTGSRILALFEGRDAAGKGGAIAATRQYMNPRSARSVALTKPTETEAGQWYFQRYITHFPAAGETVLFDRSWYNRAGVEAVMGFCTKEQYETFLEHVPRFEKMVVDEKIHFFKFYLDIGREMQLKRFHDRRHDPLHVWKLSSMDIAALNKWDDYTEKRDRMLAETHTDKTPWSVTLANDKRRARLNIIRHILLSIDYQGRDDTAIGEVDPRILLKDPSKLKSK